MDMMTVPEAARKASCGEDKVRKAIRAGTLPARKLANYWVIDAADLSQWMPPPSIAAQEPARQAASEPATQPPVKMKLPVAPPATGRVDLSSLDSFRKQEGRA